MTQSLSVSHDEMEGLRQVDVAIVPGPEPSAPPSSGGRCRVSLFIRRWTLSGRYLRSGIPSAVSQMNSLGRSESVEHVASQKRSHQTHLTSHDAAPSAHAPIRSTSVEHDVGSSPPPRSTSPSSGGARSGSPSSAEVRRRRLHRRLRRRRRSRVRRYLPLRCILIRLNSRHQCRTLGHRSRTHQSQ